MIYCYPAIILSIFSIFIIYQSYSTGLNWATVLMFALPFYSVCYIFFYFM